jgi:3-oxoadipate enol-lactonase
MRKEIKIRGINLVYDNWGNKDEGKTILLIHGQPFNRTMWDDQFISLAGRYRVIVPDLRGYGETGIGQDITTKMVLLDELALDLVHLLAELKIEKTVVIGLSQGGQVALELFRLKPSLFEGIVLADTEARAEDGKGYQNRVHLSRKLLEEGMESFVQERIRFFMCEHTFAHKPDVVGRVGQMMRTTSAAGSAAVQRGRAERLDYTPLLEGICFPALIVVGDQDAFTPLESARYMHERINGSRLAVIENCGHISNMEQPEAFNKVLLEFLG